MRHPRSEVARDALAAMAAQAVMGLARWSAAAPLVVADAAAIASHWAIDLTLAQKPFRAVVMQHPDLCQVQDLIRATENQNVALQE